MFIKKGTLLQVRHSRSGNWKGIAREDFDTEGENDFYPINLAQEEEVQGMSTIWVEGEEMPARRGLCEITVIEK